MTTLPPIAVRESTQVGTVRRAAVDLATELGFDEEDRTRVALVATEMSTNLVKHGGGDGEVLLQTAGGAGGPVVELVALDRGPGIADVGRAMQDGMSTAGTPGTGLGAIRRLATRFDLYSNGGGTAVFAAVAAAGAARDDGGFETGAVCVPYPGEHVCGDAFAVGGHDGRTTVCVVDGLGHGPLAAEAAKAATKIVAARHELAPADLMQRLHEALRPTRGAAAAIADVDARRGIVRYCGVGNIAATILANGATRSLVSHHGTLGHDARRIAEFQYPWSASSTLVLNSDGLVSNWSLARYPGLAERAASLVAAVLYRDCRRQRDDTTVLVVRGRS
jgi:anti-sigma regulatory factor (Ser/Thr protein kinase)